MKKMRTLLTSLLLLWSVAVLLTGCSGTILFDPRGPIGDTERYVIIIAFALMLIVVIPVFVMTVWFPWKFRSSNPKAVYAPKWCHSTTIEAIVWLVPAAIITLLGIMVWTTTHQLDPHKPLGTGGTPLRIEAVSLDWKWLFIYPDQGIATVNQLVFPVNVELSFRLTSSTVMTSFFIPQLGSQIYAMAGMQTRLHLLADKPGSYTGQNQQFSGRGYADMTFTATAVSKDEFSAWVDRVRQAPEKLDMERYRELEKTGSGNAVVFFSKVGPGLFEDIMDGYKTMGTDPVSDGVGAGNPVPITLRNN